ncbi:MAG TPA: class I SAM-dependent methyltransferase [Acidimicrobiia bacterium]|nr:class I SAM-dependent methyltransferase [Acidimicrobiia bacterium]
MAAEDSAERFTDRWARWLLKDRFGGDENARRLNITGLEPVRDRILTAARIAPGDIVLDVGCGDGLIGFGAIPLVGEAGRVVFTDISDQLLERCRQIASELGVADRCRLLLSQAETLDGIDDLSVDVVATRSVLIYVDDKVSAFEAFWRVLKPEGRLSLFEPINTRFAALNRETLFGFDVAPVADLAARVRAVFEAAAPPDGAMMGFDETDLLHLAESAGFSDVNVSLELSSAIGSPLTSLSWDQLMKISPNPNAPTYGEAIHQALAPEEAHRLEGHLRPLMESGAESRNRTALAYLTATKPSS